ncbi:hypothetical protein A2866_00120 [Candidatus Roizmanbacteria bacterium RIFCSPHIGHO2_01_FULL_39_8]|uniref:Addiction module toxin RelE n=1 Tax=Candidatus Roizmanbacteria bacterium RIFCSPHIGHO2_01_FULL_39_8 TaxID=1802033 RepID=A0A1F7GKT9_9BACT|nr:MAG: hypothetical protein A2866_00120 [Candidatus Roizmanbacteria bacterium RIFCSPHIGHO2_01_FULL_39_8]
MYVFLFAHSFRPTYKSLIKGLKDNEKRTNKALRLLKNDPFYPSLKSHKVKTRSFGERWSSWITGDLRVIWDFDPDEKEKIILFAIVTHTGTHREYK